MGDSFQWAKYGHHILPSSLDSTSHNKADLHRTFWNSLIEFLRTDLDENLSSNLNLQISSKLDHYLSRLLEGLSETGSKGKVFDQHLLNEKYKDYFIDEIVDIALFTTQIPQSIFTKLFHQKFEKHSMLDSVLEILQQVYIQMETEPDDFHLFTGDLSTYTLRCIRCGQSVTLHGSIGETLFHAPTAILYHWNMNHPMTSKMTENQCLCHFFSPLMTIICNHQFFSMRFELDGGFKILSKTNEIWTSYYDSGHN
jgi:hypothetical protein